MKRAKQPESIPAEPPEEEANSKEPRRRLLERPDGFYWQAADSGEEYGPFTTRVEAETDMLSGGEFEEGETLQEAESEVGMAEWIDPDTGGPAEDSVPRIEDH
jgi:hypothetical protein